MKKGYEYNVVFARISDCLSDSFKEDDGMCHPLHIILSMEDASRLVRKNAMDLSYMETRSLVGSLKGQNDSEDCEIFVFVRMVDEEVLIRKDENVKSTQGTIDRASYVTLYVSDMFLGHYNLLYDYGHVTGAVFRQVKCLPLERVVFGAKTNDCFEWAKSDDWTIQLILSSCQDKILCRVGDVFLAPPSAFVSGDRAEVLKWFFDLEVMECTPVIQGFMTVCTSIVIVKIEDPKPECDTKEPISLPAITVEEPLLKENMISYVTLMNYTSRLLLPSAMQYSHEGLNPILQSLATSSTILKALPTKFDIEIMMGISRSIKTILQSNSTDIKDPLNTVFVSHSAMQKMSLSDGSWVKVWMICSQAEERRRSWAIAMDQTAVADPGRRKSTIASSADAPKQNFRYVQICSRHGSKESSLDSMENEAIYISPHLWFCLNPSPSPSKLSTAKLLVEVPLQKPSLPSELQETVDVPQYAKEIYVVLVQSPDYNTTIDCAALLTKYFEITRYICLGDIISISSKDDPTFHQNLDDALFFKCPVVYFKVTLIEGPPSSQGYLVDRDHCRLYQTGTAQSYAPVTMETYLAPSQQHPFWSCFAPSGLTQYVEQLQGLILPFLKSVNFAKKVPANILLTGARGCGKTCVVKALCRCLNMHFFKVNCFDLVGDVAGSTEARIKIFLQRAPFYAPCILLLKYVDMIGEDPRVLSTFCNLVRMMNSGGNEYPVITIATTCQVKPLNAELSSLFLHHIHMEPPSEDERAVIIQSLLSTCVLANDVCVSYLAQRSAGFVLGDLSALVSHSIRRAYSRVYKAAHGRSLSYVEEQDVCRAGIPVIQQDFLEALDDLQVTHAQSVGAPQIPNVKWEDVGGLGSVKQEILDTIQLPLEHPEIVAAGLRRSGVLLYGPPGTGKTLLAKAVATECSVSFLSVKGPELMNMYVGQSEENVRKVFHRARSAAPCVIFFDELDSLAPNRGRSGDSGGVTDRIVSQLLTELDGLKNCTDVFVIGATNRPDLIDPALLRPGRFDRLLYVGVAEDSDSRLGILKALTRKFRMADDVILEELEHKCPCNLTGADFYALCSNAMLQAVGRNINLIEKGKLQSEDTELIISNEDFEHSLKTLVPSVSMEELQRYQEIKVAVAR